MKKSTKIVSVVFTLVLIAICILPFSAEVFAKNQEIYKIKQTDQTQTSISVDWTAYLEERGTHIVSNQVIEIYEGRVYGDNNSPIQTVPVENDVRTYVFEGLKAGTEYTVKYKAVGDLGEGYNFDISDNAFVYTLPGKVKGIQQDKWWYWNLACDVKWDKQEGVDGYEYIVKDYKKKTIEKSPEDHLLNSCGFFIKNNIVYNVKARAYTELNGKKYFGDWSNTAYCFSQPMVNGVSYGKGKMTVKWNKVNGCDDYTIYVSTKEKKGYKKVKTVKASKTSVTIGKVDGKAVSSKKTYYFYIVGTKKVKGKKYTSGRHYTQEVKNGRVNIKWTF